jgi:hypothetical protein
MPTHRYVADAAQLAAFAARAKLQACPHCLVVGTLIGHGSLRGYSDQETGRVVRGHRFFCSNRHRRAGCGRTFPVLFSEVLFGFVVRLGTVFRFVEAVAAGLSRWAAWGREVAAAMSLRTAYRLWRRLRAAQVTIRARLCRVCPPPESSSREPLVQLLSHLRRAFPASPSPFAAYQLSLQAGFLV